jgi:hypothetical protein
MCDSLGPSVLQDVVQVCTLLKVLLADFQDEETLTVSLGLLIALVSGTANIKKEEEFLFDDLLSDLDRLCFHDSEQVVELATEAKMKITSRGSSWTFDTTSSSQQSNQDLKEILKDLNDPLIPVRAYGLVALRKLVLSRDSQAVKNLDKIVEVFINQMQDPER